MKDDENISLVLIVIWKKRIKRLRDDKNNVKRIYTCLQKHMLLSDDDYHSLSEIC
jgi:hypothetical protein